jgi:ATP-dependent Zn protease
LKATNRADVLDKAMNACRSFWQTNFVDLPLFVERAEIFKVHLLLWKKVEGLDTDFLTNKLLVSLWTDIANVCNETLLIAYGLIKQQWTNKIS